MHFLAPLLLALSTLTVASPLSTTPNLGRRATGSIENVIFGGNGCPQGSQLTSWGDTDYSVFVFPVNTFSARAGGSTPLTESRKNCQITLEISHPAGTQFSIDWTRFTGYARLQHGAVARHQGLYYFSGETEQTSTALELNGPFRGEYELKKSPSENWSACGGTQALSIGNSVRIEQGDGVIQGRAGGEARFEIGLKWRSC